MAKRSTPRNQPTAGGGTAGGMAARATPESPPAAAKTPASSGAAGGKASNLHASLLNALRAQQALSREQNPFEPATHRLAEGRQMPISAR